MSVLGEVKEMTIYRKVKKLREKIIEFWDSVETEVLLTEARKWITQDPVCDVLLKYLEEAEKEYYGD